MSEENKENNPDELDKDLKKQLKKVERKLARSEEILTNYERLVDRTQHMLNKRIEEVETARRKLTIRTHQLEHSELRFRQLADAAFETIIIHMDGKILDCNEAATSLYGIPKDQLIGSDISLRIHESFHESATEWLKGPTKKAIELSHVRGDGTSVPVEVRSRAIEHEGRDALVTAVRDITAHKALQKKLERIANSDPLTGVGNRRFFLDAGKRIFFRAIRYNEPLALIMVDVDYFKKINDTYGHDGGDIALCAMANTCMATLRTSDIFARFGGEEFAALLPASDITGSTTLAERLRVAIAEMSVDSPAGLISLTVSIGITVLQEDDQNIEGLLTRADKALYTAKESGRNRVVLYVDDGAKPVGS